MKCIKNKCRYCKDSLFWGSRVECILDGSSFPRDSEKECVIPKYINELQKDIEFLQKYGRFIKFKNKTNYDKNEFL